MTGVPSPGTEVEVRVLGGWERASVVGPDHLYPHSHVWVRWPEGDETSERVADVRVMERTE